MPHHFIKSRSITEPYSAGQYAGEVLPFLTSYFETHNLVLLVGGSGLYVKAVCEGFDDVPPSDPEVREELNARLRQDGLDVLLNELRQVDPAYYATVDRANPRRVMRGLEVWMITGEPFSSFRKMKPVERPFDVLKVGLGVPAEELKEKIRLRVDEMVARGLVGEARALLPYGHLPALQTVGYRELFMHFDGQLTLDEATELIKKNTIQFARRQMTWWRKDKTIEWYDPAQFPDIVARVERWLGS